VPLVLCTVIDSNHLNATRASVAGEDLTEPNLD